MSVQSEKYLEERVQRFLDSEVLKGDKEKVLYLRLYNRLRPFKEKKSFLTYLRFNFLKEIVEKTMTLWVLVVLVMLLNKVK